MTPSSQGMGAEKGERALTRMLGNYLTEAQAARMAETSRSPHAMTARVGAQQGHIQVAMTATTFNSHMTEEPMLAQTGVMILTVNPLSRKHSQKLQKWARRRSHWSKISAQVC